MMKKDTDALRWGHLQMTKQGVGVLILLELAYCISLMKKKRHYMKFEPVCMTMLQ
ncbi:hypothetical protein SAMN02745978_00038 [Butyricicoccus pullicaecorum DSM 23266]|uniref:Uncharacterized protein n=1 Tax=Butyricicoccus pullicaecorum 1.2 TaxID=1203606 RepID=R8W2K3_9FIRM|nr:hypothetical protein HMPREF1526_01812 [Butyricicoccus pullicaecorum 1.2]SKA52388.1 hypothetical protein SAMN02745978_00038 [Butyricicoccus pullicaecorum DSM 23266]